MKNYYPLRSLEFFIASVIFKNKGEMESFSIFRKTNVNFNEFMKALLNLDKRGIVVIEGSSISLSESGYKLLYINRGVKRTNSRIPEYMKSDYVLPIGAPYIPKLDAVQSILKN
jgi:predicted transcriptional regulator